MIVFRQVGTGTPSALSGIVEADETFQCESRKRWSEHGRKGPPQAIVRNWQRPLFGVVDRTGQSNFCAYRLELAGGHRLRISGTYDPEALARLIRGLSL